MIVQRFNLNLIPNQSPVIVHVNQYDTGAGRLIATLYEGNEPYSPNGTAVIQGTKPDGHGFQYTATLDGNVVTADLTEQMSPVAGDVRVQIVVTESSGVTGTFVFIMRVQPSALPSDTDMSESDYQYIEEAIREAQEAVQTAQEATETAQEAVERAQEAIAETQENAEDSEAWAQGTRGGIPVGPTDPTYEHNAEYWAQYAERYAQGGLHYKGSIPFADIPTTGMREGDMYNITDDFTTDSRFEEGAGIEVKGGTNIAWNSDDKWDVLALPPKTTFNGRSGSILPMAGDYDSRKILLSSALHIGGETQNDVQEALEALSNDGVKSFNGRSGSVLPMAGDYDSEKILLASVLHISGETQDNAQEALEALENNKVDEVMYEEEIHGVNLLKCTMSNHTINGVTFSVNNGIITLSGTSTGEINVGDSNGTIGKISDLKEGQAYTLSGCPANGSSTTYRLVVINENDMSEYYTDMGGGIKFTAKNTTYIVYIRANSGVNLSNLVFRPMIRKADIEDSTYRPYNHQAIQNQLNAQGVLGAKNLLKSKNTLKTVTTAGITFTVNDDGSITANGTATADAFYEYVRGTNDVLEKGKSYIASTGQSANGGLHVYYKVNDSDTWTQLVSAVTEEKEFFLPSNANFILIRMFIGNGNTVLNKVYYPMLRLASDPDDTYQPYAMTNRELMDFVTPTVLSGVDLNNITTPGWYSLNGSITNNAGFSNGYLLVQKHFTGTIKQIAMPMGELNGAERVYIRSKQFSNFTSWYMFAGTVVS